MRTDIENYAGAIAGIAVNPENPNYTKKVSDFVDNIEKNINKKRNATFKLKKEDVYEALKKNIETNKDVTCKIKTKLGWVYIFVTSEEGQNKEKLQCLFVYKARINIKTEKIREALVYFFEEENSSCNKNKNENYIGKEKELLKNLDDFLITTCPECGHALYLQKNEDSGKLYWLCVNIGDHGLLEARFNVKNENEVGEHCEDYKIVKSPCPHPECFGEALQFVQPIFGSRETLWACTQCRRAGRKFIYMNKNGLPDFPKNTVNTLN